MAFDIAWGGEAMDLTSPEGFIGAIYHACRLSPGTGCLAAPVCSSFVYMFFSSFSKRSLFEEWQRISQQREIWSFRGLDPMIIKYIHK